MDSKTTPEQQKDIVSELVSRALAYTAPGPDADERTKDESDRDLLRIARLEYTVREIILSSKLYTYGDNA